MKIPKRSKSLFSLFIILTFISACSNPRYVKTTKTIEPLVSAKWLNVHLNDTDLVVLDTSVIVNMGAKGGFSIVSGREQYNSAHIPTAGFADLLGNLSATDNPLKFIMPTPQQFKLAIEELGISNESRVVLYSTKNPDWPARLWWMLRWAGFDNVALLDGGINAWKAEGFALSAEVTNHTKTSFTLNLRPAVIAEQDEVLASIDNPKINIVDALPSAHYMGMFSMYQRTGHISSASNLPSADLLDSSGLFKSKDELDMMLDGDHTNRVITYCGGGVSASSVAFTMHRLGYSDVSVYMGSLQEWTSNAINPMTKEIKE